MVSARRIGAVLGNRRVVGGLGAVVLLLGLLAGPVLAGGAQATVNGQCVVEGDAASWPITVTINGAEGLTGTVVINGVTTPYTIDGTGQVVIAQNGMAGVNPVTVVDDLVGQLLAEDLILEDCTPPTTTTTTTTTTVPVTTTTTTTTVPVTTTTAAVLPATGVGVLSYAAAGAALVVIGLAMLAAALSVAKR